MNFLAGMTTITGCGAQAVSSNVATCTTSALPVGSASITAVYSGDTNNAGATSPAFTQTVNQATPTIAITGNGSSTVGSSVTYTATLSGGVSATGTLNFKSGTTSITGCGTQTIASNVATCTTSALPVGSASITAVYSGDTNNTGATSPAITQTVNQAAPTIAITGNGTSTVGSSVTFTATLTGGVSATGTMNFRSGVTTITGCGAQTVASNVATCTTNVLPVGSASITAVYSGDTSNAVATSPAVTQTVNQAATTTAVTSNTNPNVAGNAVTFTATVTGVSPGGSINFKAGGSTMTGCGSVSLTSGSASCVSTFSTAGTYVITAEYSGDTNNVASTGTLSGGQIVTPPVALTAVQSRKIHGIAGTFDLSIDTTQAINGLITVEPRIIGGGHTIVFQFNGPISTSGTASVTPIGTAMAVSSGNDVIVTLTNVPDNQRVTVTLANVNGSVSPPPVSIGFLIGDVNSSASITPSDISSVKARSGQTTTAANFRYDLNTTGAINASDIAAVKARSDLVLP